MMNCDIYGPGDEVDFKRRFIASFLASMEVKNYSDNCSRGWKGHKERIPVEDAFSLADTVWERMIEERM